MDVKYTGTARDANDNLIGRVNGTIQEVSNWADNIIRSKGECTITIIPLFDEGNEQ